MRVVFILLLALAGSLTPTGARPASERPHYRVLSIGNSLIYVNNLPAVLAALAAAQPDPVVIETATYVQGGGSIAERWSDGAAASALRRGGWDAVILQERGALPECVARADTRRERGCRASIQAHRAFSELARAQDARVLLLETWNDEPATSALLHDGTRLLARASGAQVVHTGELLQAYVRRHGAGTVFVDRVHPRLTGALMMAAQIHETLTGKAPVAAPVHITFRLLPPEAPIDPRQPLEVQSQLMQAPASHVLSTEAVRPFLEFAATH